MTDKKMRLPPAFIVAGTASDDGKTTVTLGLMEAFRRRGLSVQPFKAGPDYIDPGLHSSLLKKPSYNLDTWMMGTRGVKKTFVSMSCGSDIAVIEGVMGLFDGKFGHRSLGSTAHIARLLDIPVLLVVDASGTARSAGAIVSGFERFDPRVKVKWVVFNRVRSPRHFDTLKDSLPRGSRVKALGFMPYDEALSIGKRHLGLTTSGDIERGRWKKFIGKAASHVGKNIDINELLGPAGGKRPYPVEVSPCKKDVRIAVAFDRAFCFYYEENLELLKSSGAALVYFSPITDKELPEGIDGIYLGGGYPELHAKELSENSSLRGGIKRLAVAGLPIFAECGGLMYLGRAITDAGGASFPMAGVFPWQSKMLPRRKSLGYRKVMAAGGCPMIRPGAILKGHEFHYSEISKPPANIKRAFKLLNPDSTDTSEGYVLKNTLASYIHIHFASNPSFAKGFVRACREFKASKSRSI